MAFDSAAFVGSVPELYDRHLGPVFMEPYARDLARRVEIPAAGRLLELACGTGKLTRELVAALAANVTIDATDLNDAMLDVARARVSAPNVHWSTADALSLPFEAEQFDAAVCQFGVMFFPDKAQAAGQVRRVLKPRGSYWFNVWGTLDENPVSRVSHDAIAKLFDADPPTFFHVPFGYNDRDRIVADLRAGGFTSVEIEVVDKQAEAESAGHMAVGLVQGNPIIGAINERGLSPAAVTSTVADALAREFGDAPMRAPMRVLVVHAR
jgi:SAM-dependent methyltransferase